MNVSNAAIQFAEMGYRVFPCVKANKAPATMHGCLDATTDLAQIEKWWGLWPEANLAVSTDGLLLVDLDPLEDGSQNPWLQDESRMTDLMRGACAITPRGGRHCWFRQPAGAGLRSSAGKIAQNVDIRADGGYVLTPPSMTADGVYSWAEAYELTMGPNELPLPPQWLLDLIRSSKGERQTVSNVSYDVREGERNSTLARLAGYMRRGGAIEPEIREFLRAANHTRCRPPLEDEEVDKIAWSISRYEPDQITQATIEGWAKSDVRPPIVPDPGDLSEVYCDVPGFLGDLIKWNLDTAHRPQPVLALAAGIALMGTLTGHRITDRIGTRTNVYTLGVAPSGFGKEHARKCNKEVLQRANMESFIGPEGIGSHAGLVSAVDAQRVILFQIDEIGRFLKTVQNPSRNPHLYQIVTVLLKMFTSANSLYVGDAYADLKNVKRIEQPHACLYGTTVPESFFESLTKSSLKDGFIGRLLVFESPRGAADSIDDDDDDDDDEPDFRPSESLIEVAAWWRDYLPGGAIAHQFPKPRVLIDSDSSKRAFRAFRTQISQDDPVSSAIWIRGYEKARKLALIYSASENREAVEISGDAAEWGCGIVSHLSRRMEFLASTWVADGVFEAASLKVLRAIEAAGSAGMTGSELCMATRGLRPRERQEILDSLRMAGSVVQKDDNGENGGRRKYTYTAARFC